jgi:hypothetical protein
MTRRAPNIPPQAKNNCLIHADNAGMLPIMQLFYTIRDLQHIQSKINSIVLKSNHHWSNQITKTFKIMI